MNPVVSVTTSSTNITCNGSADGTVAANPGAGRRTPRVLRAGGRAGAAALGAHTGGRVPYRPLPGDRFDAVGFI